jgi:hypothetical protein
MTKKRRPRKKKYKIKPKNLAAASLSLPQFRQQVVKSKYKLIPKEIEYD